MQSILDWIADRIEPFGLFRTLITLIFFGLTCYTIFELLLTIRTLKRAVKSSGEEIVEEAAQSLEAQLASESEPEKGAGVQVASIRPMVSGQAHEANAQASQRLGVIASELHREELEKAAALNKAAKDDDAIGKAWEQAHLLRATAGAFRSLDMSEERRLRLERMGDYAISIGKKLVYIRLLKIVSFSTLRVIWFELLLVLVLLCANALATYYFYTME